MCQSVQQRESVCVPFAATFAFGLTLRWQVLSALSNAALDNAFASAVLGKKVSGARLRGRQLRQLTRSCPVTGGRHPRESVRYRGFNRPCSPAAAAVGWSLAASDCCHRGALRPGPLPSPQSSGIYIASSASSVGPGSIFSRSRCFGWWKRPHVIRHWGRRERILEICGAVGCRFGGLGFQ